MRAWPAVLLLLVAAACGDASEFAVRSAPPTAAKPPPPTGPVDEWCAVLAEVDPQLPLFSGATVQVGTSIGIEAATEALVAAYDRLAEAPPAAIAADMAVVRDGYVSFRDDLAVVDYEYEKVFAGIGQRPWQSTEFRQAGQRVADFGAEQCGVETVVQRSDEFDATGRQFLVDAFVDTGLSVEQAGCLADALGPDLSAGAGQPMAFEDAMAQCGVTFEDFIPEG